MFRLAAIGCSALALAACSADPIELPAPGNPGGPAGSAQSTASPTGRNVPKSEVPERLGAATWLPADTAYYSSSQKLGWLLLDLYESEAVSGLLRMPMFAGFARQVRSQLDAATTASRRNPVLGALTQLLREGLDRELFVACGAEATEVLSAVGAVFGDAMLASMAAGLRGNTDDDPTPLLVDAVLAHGDELRLPPVLFGMRVDDRRRAEELLGALSVMAGQMPGEILDVDGAPGFRCWRLTPDDLPGWRGELQRELQMARVADEKVRAFVDWLSGLQLCVSAGMRGNHLLVSVAHSPQHLARLGHGDSLASTPVFARARARERTPLFTTYVAQGLQSAGGFDGDALVDAISAAMPAAPSGETSHSLGALLADLRTCLREIGSGDAPVDPYLSVTYRLRGLETWTVGGPRDAADASRPLAIANNAGPAPLLAMAARAAPVLATYRRISHWTRIMYGHFGKLATPRMTAADRAEFERFRDVVVPTITEIDAIVSRSLLPAIDGAESLMLLDGTFELHVPGNAGSRPSTMQLPRPALVMRVADASAVVDACERMRVALDGLLRRVGPGGQAHASLPPPTERDVLGGKCYEYELPDMPRGIAPCVLVAGDAIAVALSLQHAQEVLARTVAPKGDVVEFDAPASAITSANVTGWADVVRRNAESVLRGMARSGELPARQAQGLFQTHRRGDGRAGGHSQLRQSHMARRRPGRASLVAARQGSLVSWPLLVLLTAAPVVLGGLVGRRRGARRVVCSWVQHALAVAIAWPAAWAAFAWRWHAPFGLVTPLVLAAALGGATLLALRRRGAEGPAAAIDARDRRLGALAGAGSGLAAAIGFWLVLPLCVARESPPATSAPTTGAWTRIASMAHRGLLRHLPVIGSASDEVDALITVLNSSPAQRRRLAHEHGLEQLVREPSVMRALDDHDVRADLVRAQHGSLTALYRLQAHPRILAVAECDAVRRVVGELRPTALAASLERQR